MCVCSRVCIVYIDCLIISASVALVTLDKPTYFMTGGFELHLRVPSEDEIFRLFQVDRHHLDSCFSK